MTLLTENPAPPSYSVSSEDGGARGNIAVLEIPFIQQGRYWCANCGGDQTFILVDRFTCGWRGYCLGCEETKYVMDDRTNSEVA